MKCLNLSLTNFRFRGTLTKYATFFLQIFLLECFSNFEKENENLLFFCFSVSFSDRRARNLDLEDALFRPQPAAFRCQVQFENISTAPSNLFKILAN